MATESPITTERLREMFCYDPASGKLTRKIVTGRNVHVGDVVGSDHGDGYLSVKIAGKSYYVHRIIWKFVTGEWPKNFIDHIDLNRSNNSFANLREADRVKNGQNRRKMSHNSTGFKGVSWSAASKKFTAQIKIQGTKQRHLGFFNDAESAYEAYCNAARAAFGEFARFD